MLLFIYILIALNACFGANAYSNNLFNLIQVDRVVNTSGDCSGLNNPVGVIKIHQKLSGIPEKWNETLIQDFNFSTVSNDVTVEDDPYEEFEFKINRILFGETLDRVRETYQNKSGVHLSAGQWLHRDHCYLNLTKDFMQTAVNAFNIFLKGSTDDVLRLPPIYVLKSARTIAMMNIAQEKLAATWQVVKGDRDTEEITIQTLEYYRPLFKYVTGKEIARLNLQDDRILSYIGTHAELDRHQMGVVASRYIKLNENWSTPKYLNLMNNLICGLPVKYLRGLPENIWLQLSHQLFYHIKACDAFQRRFYLKRMTNTQVLGKSNSWSARDVARLGLLLIEVNGPALSAINPEAIAGVTSQVMLEMSAKNLVYLTKVQLRYLTHKPLNILTKKILNYEDTLLILNSVVRSRISLFNFISCSTVALKITT